MQLKKVLGLERVILVLSLLTRIYIASHVRVRFRAKVVRRAGSGPSLRPTVTPTRWTIYSSLPLKYQSAHRVGSDVNDLVFCLFQLGRKILKAKRGVHFQLRGKEEQKQSQNAEGFDKFHYRREAS